MSYITKTFSQKYRLLNELIFGFFLYNFSFLFPRHKPKRVLVALTYHCNSRCIMCNIWKMIPKNELSLDEWSSMFSDPLFSDIETLDITGGEAFLAKGFIKKITLFLEKMPKIKRVTIVSNGFSTNLIVKRIKKLVKLLNSRGITLNISISLDGTEKMHETIRRVPQAFKKTTSTILKLKKLEQNHSNLSVSVGSLIMHQNLDSIEEVISWLKNNKIDYGLQIVGFHDTYVDNLDTEDSTDFQKRDKSKLFTLLKDLSKPTSWRDVRSYYWRDLLAMYKDKKRRTTPCPFLQDQLAVDSLGNIYNCFSTSAVGNIRNKQTPSDIYLSPKNLKHRKKMWNAVCKKCNSGCSASEATAKDFKSYLYFRLTGKPFYGFKNIFK